MKKCDICDGGCGVKRCLLSETKAPTTKEKYMRDTDPYYMTWLNMNYKKVGPSADWVFNTWELLWDEDYEEGTYIVDIEDDDGIHEIVKRCTEPGSPVSIIFRGTIIECIEYIKNTGL